MISYILTRDESPKRQVHDETSIRTNKTRELGQPKTSEHRDEGTVEPCKELQESKSTAASFGILWSSCRFSRFNVFSDVGDFLRFNRHFFNFPIFLTSNGQFQMILSFERQRFGGIFQVVIVFAFSSDFWLFSLLSKITLSASKRKL